MRTPSKSTYSLLSTKLLKYCVVISFLSFCVISFGSSVVNILKTKDLLSINTLDKLSPFSSTTTTSTKGTIHAHDRIFTRKEFLHALEKSNSYEYLSHNDGGNNSTESVIFESVRVLLSSGGRSSGGKGGSRSRSGKKSKGSSSSAAYYGQHSGFTGSNNRGNGSGFLNCLGRTEKILLSILGSFGLLLVLFVCFCADTRDNGGDDEEEDDKTEDHITIDEIYEKDDQETVCTSVDSASIPSDVV